MENEHYKLDSQTLTDLFFDSLHLMILHYGLWFLETEHQLGLDKAIDADGMVWQQLLPSMLKRLSPRLKLPVGDDGRLLLDNLSQEEMVALLEDMGKSWLACDGIWFQVVEQNYDQEMFTAKRINDTNWVRFSYIEARVIMKRLNLPPNGGIPVLREALKYRQYALVNKQEIIDGGKDRIIFRMNDCRVQSARKRRGLPDYPCKSAGVVEYSRFAEAIDPRIKTRCLGCPPDDHPDDWWCAWEFTIGEK